MELDVAYASRTQLVAIGRHVVVRIIDQHATEIADFERLEALIADRLAATPLFGVLQVSWHGTPMPPAPALRVAARLMDDYADRACVVVALLGLGFWSATLASAMSSFSTLLRRSRIEVTTSVEAASERLSSELLGLNAEALVADYERLYAHMRTLGPQPA